MPSRLAGSNIYVTTAMAESRRCSQAGEGPFFTPRTRRSANAGQSDGVDPKSSFTFTGAGNFPRTGLGAGVTTGGELGVTTGGELGVTTGG